MSEQAQSTPQESLEMPVPSADQELRGPVLGTREPDRMVYKDDEGVEHSIYIPVGQFQVACQHYTNKDWEALG